MERSQAFNQLGWLTFSQNFIATSDLTLLTFIDTRGAFNAGIYLDDVSVEAVSAVPGPIAGAGLPGLILASGAFSAGGDGGRKSPELPAQSAHVVCNSQRLPNNPDL